MLKSIILAPFVYLTVVAGAVTLIAPDKPVSVTKPVSVQPAKPDAYAENNRKAYAKMADDAKFELRMATTRTLVTAMLRDPASGQFGITYRGHKSAVCGSINARNGFGGMTGQVAFVRVGDALPMFDSVNNDAFIRAWNRHCLVMK